MTSEAPLSEQPLREQPPVEPRERELRWKISPDEIRKMTPEQRTQFLIDEHERLVRIYEAVMLVVDSQESGVAIKPADIDVILHPEKRDQYHHLTGLDSPEH